MQRLGDPVFNKTLKIKKKINSLPIVEVLIGDLTGDCEEKDRNLGDLDKL